MTADPRSSIDELLDRIDAERHAVDEVVRRLNEYESLDPHEQDAWYEDGGALGYAGVGAHPLTELCGEAHNAFFVLRDLDGSLKFVFEISPRERRWEVGPLYRGNLADEDLEPYLEGERSLDALGMPLDAAEFKSLLDALPDDPPGPLRRF